MGQADQYKKFQLVNGGFNFKEVFHPFSMVTHLFYSAVGVRVNFETNPSLHGATLIISLNNGHAITLHFHDQVFWKNRASDLANLWDVYTHISHETFDQRMDGYLSQLKKKGYFDYDECRFYPPDKVVFRGRTFTKQETNFLRSPGYIELRSKGRSFWDKMKRELSISKIPQFNTESDTDVIFAILTKYFGLSWEL